MTEHVDVDVAFEDGGWELGIHDETNDVEFASDEVLLFVSDEALTTRPMGTECEGGTMCVGLTGFETLGVCVMM